MKQSIHILVAGIGGVGGYFGGRLARYYQQQGGVTISFLARGAHLACIQQQGLHIEENNSIWTAHPHAASDHAATLGIADYILLAVKSYDLVAVLEQLRPAVAPHTVFIPLLNGVESREQVQAVYPQHIVAGGCVYIVANRPHAGTIKKTGAIERLFIGMEGALPPALQVLAQRMQQAGLDAHATERIKEVMWEKFYLVGVNATATTYFEQSTGAVLADEHKAVFTWKLLNELDQLAKAKGICFEEDMVAATKTKFMALPYETQSSMQRDFQQGGRTELDILTGYIVRESNILSLPCPAFDEAYAALGARSLKTQP